MATSRPEGTVNPDAVRIATCQKTGSRGRADWLSRVPLGEHAALFRHSVEIGSLEALSSEFTDIRVSLIICEDDDDVWGAFFGKSVSDAHGDQQETKGDFVHKKGWKSEIGFLPYPFFLREGAIPPFFRLI